MDMKSLLASLQTAETSEQAKIMFSQAVAASEVETVRDFKAQLSKHLNEVRNGAVRVIGRTPGERVFVVSETHMSELVVGQERKQSFAEALEANPNFTPFDSVPQVEMRPRGHQDYVMPFPVEDVLNVGAKRMSPEALKYLLAREKEKAPDDWHRTYVCEIYRKRAILSINGNLQPCWVMGNGILAVIAKKLVPRRGEHVTTAILNAVTVSNEKKDGINFRIFGVGRGSSIGKFKAKFVR